MSIAVNISHSSGVTCLVLTSGIYVFRNMKKTGVPAWSCEDVTIWLKENKFERHVELFKHHMIDGSVLMCMTESDLRQPPLQLNIFGDIKKLNACIHKLQVETYGEEYCNLDTVDGITFTNLSSSSVQKARKFQRLLSNDSVSDVEDEIIDEEVERIVNRTGRYTKNVDSELFKTALSFIYVFLVFLVTSFVMTVVHDRVPDPEKYPPLPDLFLDNLPYIPWAFEVCEMVGVTLFSIWGCILFFHKHRYIFCTPPTDNNYVTWARCFTFFKDYGRFITEFAIYPKSLLCHSVLSRKF